MHLASGAGAMKTLVLRALSLPALATCLLLACGGKTEGGPSGGSSSGGSSSSGGGSSGSGGSSSGGVSSGSSSGSVVGCVFVDLSTYDQSCKQASDCIAVASGEVCADQCNCPQSVVNASEQGRYDQAISSIQSGTCFCSNEPLPQCIDNQCTLDTSVAIDAGPTPDSGVCVDVDPTTFDRSCKADTDCIDVTTGVLCTGQCACGGTPINVDGQATYDAEVAPLGTGTACPCPPDGVTRCLQNQCTLCGFGPNQPAGCPDGG